MLGFDVVSMEQIKKINYDYILISSANFEDEIYEQLIEYGFCQVKIICLYDEGRG
jgi:ABC-type Fe3+-hydroxamate transport system substrate-binding protein